MQIEEVTLRVQDAKGQQLCLSQGYLPSMERLWAKYCELYNQYERYIKDPISPYLPRELIDNIEVEDTANDLDLGSVDSQTLHTCFQQLGSLTNQWLKSEGMEQIYQSLQKVLYSDDHIEFIIQSCDDRSREAPSWNDWDLIQQHYPHAGVSLSVLSNPLDLVPKKISNFNSYSQRLVHLLDKAKVFLPKLKFAQSTCIPNVLFIFGHQVGIDLSREKQLMADLADSGKIIPTVLEEPSLEELIEELLKNKHEILVYAGHSSIEGLLIQSEDPLKVNDLHRTLKRAIGNGLKLAIFNSCDGNNLSQCLSQLGIPAVVHMRHLIPNTTAGFFIKLFFHSLEKDQYLPLALREATDGLSDYGHFQNNPCAAWLPAAYRNPQFLPPRWSTLGVKRLTIYWRRVILSGVAFIALLGGFFTLYRAGASLISSTRPLCNNASCINLDPLLARCAPSEDFPSIPSPETLIQTVGTVVDNQSQRHNYTLQLRFSPRCQATWLRLESKTAQGIQGHSVYLEDTAGKKYSPKYVTLQHMTSDYYSDMAPGKIPIKACAQPHQGELTCTSLFLPRKKNLLGF